MIGELLSIAEREIEALGIPGAAIGVVSAGRSATGGVGVANRETGLPFTADTVFPMQSITKTFTAAAVMHLVEAGRLTRETPVRDLLPGFRLADADATARLTVGHLLTHTGGFVGDVEELFPASRGDDALATVTERMRDVPQVTPPGALYSYSNAGFMVLGRIVEVLAGRPYEQVVHELILEPLGLEHTCFFAEDAITRPIAVGHEDGEICRDWAAARAAAPEAGVFSTANDLLTWARYWLGADPTNGALLSPATRRAMLDEQLLVGGDVHAIGLGWHLSRYGEVRVAAQSGAGHGIQNQLLLAPDAGLGLVVLTNSQPGIQLDRVLTAEAMERFAGASPPPERRLPLAQGDADGYAGTYMAPGLDGGDLLRVTPADEGLDLTLEAEAGGKSYRFATRTRFCDADVVVALDGLFAGRRAAFLRRDDEIFALRFGGQVCLRERVA